ncbi:5' nucleotidase, NT5C type [Persicitalea jodogahamensis]|uniref:Uncharacterized protein n=1 Tax=Persicitalea jodogahamensis TaxID=402147 RepID=A0A8J3D6M4_9BACT|nr:5'(3')-deoxyribonucleotidase [Persicitalea jodogahamensis]GHB81952.1 hypothetical protein GCM10007390_41170 [Persicitalea jodogahamensis]
MLRITLDMDDVLADTHGKLIDYVLNEFDTHYLYEDFRKTPIKELLHPKQFKKMYTYIHQSGFFKDIPVMEGAQETVQELSQYYEIFVATAALEFPNSFREKYDWLQSNFPDIAWKNIVFCGDKSIISSDFLIDDHVKNMLSFTGKGILYSAPHNMEETAYPRVANWREIREMFLPKE